MGVEMVNVCSFPFPCCTVSISPLGECWSVLLPQLKPP